MAAEGHPSLPHWPQDLHHLGNPLGDFLPLNLAGKVGFVENRHCRTALQRLQQLPVLPGQGNPGLSNTAQHQPAVLHTAACQIHPHRFHRVIGSPDARCVRQVEHHILQPDHILHHIPSGAGNVGDNAALGPGQKFIKVDLPTLGQ